MHDFFVENASWVKTLSDLDRAESQQALRPSSLGPDVSRAPILRRLGQSVPRAWKPVARRGLFGAAARLPTGVRAQLYHLLGLMRPDMGDIERDYPSWIALHDRIDNETRARQMKRIRLIRIVLVVVLVLGCLSFAIFRAREPRYQGRTLSEWIKEGRAANEKYLKNPKNDRMHPETDPAWQAASHAVKRCGPDTIPFLLKLAQANDSSSKTKLSYWLNQHLSSHLPIEPAWNRNLTAMSGFWMLGSESKPAWPVLIQWTYDADWERRYVAFECLAESRPDKGTFLPVLLRSIHDPHPRIQEDASYILHYLYPLDAEAAGIYKMFPKLKNTPTYQPSTNLTHVK